MEVNNKKKCFIITPIGNEGSDIRRHIDGIVDAAIIPVLEDELGYKVEVSHRIDMPGNIPKQVITSVFDSELVIANLTDNNPNVMYELALRHCFGSVVIIIAKDGTVIPSDIKGERTIFYIDDAKGVIELKDDLRSMVTEINKCGKIEQYGPVYDALRDKLNKDNIIKEFSDQKTADAFTLIIDRLDNLEKNIYCKNDSINTTIGNRIKPDLEITISSEKLNKQKLRRVVEDAFLPILKKMQLKYSYLIGDNNVAKIFVTVSSLSAYKTLTNMLDNVTNEFGEGDFKISYVLY